MPSVGHKGYTSVKGNVNMGNGVYVPNTTVNRAMSAILGYTPWSAVLPKNVTSALTNAWTAVKDGAKDVFGNTSGSVSGSASGTASGTASGSSSGFVVKDGKVEFADPNLQYIMQMINQQSAANNEWSAEQAQKQMDFQKMMSDTAHQREVADLQAAGLNPVLSAGGSGAQVTSGAMAQADDSNTRLIAELAMSALDAMSNTAVGVAASAGGSNKGSIWNNYYVRRAAGSFASQLGWKAAGAAAKLLF